MARTMGLNKRTKRNQINRRNKRTKRTKVSKRIKVTKRMKRGGKRKRTWGTKRTKIQKGGIEYDIYEVLGTKKDEGDPHYSYKRVRLGVLNLEEIDDVGYDEYQTCNVSHKSITGKGGRGNPATMSGEIKRVPASIHGINPVYEIKVSSGTTGRTRSGYFAILEDWF